MAFCALHFLFYQRSQVVANGGHASDGRHTKTPLGYERRFCVSAIQTRGNGPANRADPDNQSEFRQLPDTPHHFGDDLQVQQELLGGLELVVGVAGVFDFRSCQAELHAVGQVMHGCRAG